MKNKLFDLGPSLRTHIFMLGACSLLLVSAAVGVWTTPASGWQSILEAAAALLPISMLTAILWHDRGNFEKRNAALTLPWTVVLIALIPSIAVLSARFRFPLRDAMFVKIDDAMGFSVPGAVYWSAHHHILGTIFDRSYPLLFLLLPAAILLPPIIGNRKASDQFILANTIAFLISFPLFTLWPAVGPWYGYNFPGNPAQRACEASIHGLHGGASDAAIVGIVCFPSFHVIWAVLSAWSLWSIPLLRIPATLVAFLIVISTVTTGWHYVADVLAGFVICAVALLCTKAIARGRFCR
jgi:hypothetical protein